MTPALRRLLAVTLVLACACAQAQTSVATIERITTAPGTAAPVARVKRGNTTITANAGLPLEPGDEIETGEGTRAVVRYTQGAAPVDVTLAPGSRARASPLYLAAGQALVRKLKGYFAVETALATASSESTEYVVSIEEGGNAVSVVVLDGTVQVRTAGVGGTTVAGANEEVFVEPRPRTRGTPTGGPGMLVVKRPADGDRLAAARALGQ